MKSEDLRSGDILRAAMEKRQAKHIAMEEQFGRGFADPTRHFSVNRAEQTVIDAWLENLKPQILIAQGKGDNLQPNEPYYGTIGGGISYNFTPTGIGTILIVRESITGQELNVTAALDWFFFD